MKNETHILTGEHFDYACGCSFCTIKKNVKRFLEKQGFNVYLEKLRLNWKRYPIVKTHFNMAIFYQNKVFGDFYFEANKMPMQLKDFVERYFDYVLCASTFIRDAWINSGIKDKTLIMNSLGADIGLYNPYNTTKEKKVFRFLSVGNWQHVKEWQDRKGLSITIEIFKALFTGRKDVELIIKTDQNCPCKYLGDNIKLIKQRLTEVAMAELFKSCDVYISAHKGEGFGLGAYQALCTGLDIGATNYSGVTDFLNGCNATLFRYTLIDSIIHPKKEYKDETLPQFAEPNREDIKNFMLNAINGKIIKNTIKDFQKYSWQDKVKNLILNIREQL